MIERFRAKSQFGPEVLGLSNCFFSRKDAIPINRDAKFFLRLCEKQNPFL
jgi:hypothetical protein